MIQFIDKKDLQKNYIKPTGMISKDLHFSLLDDDFNILYNLHSCRSYITDIIEAKVKSKFKLSVYDGKLTEQNFDRLFNRDIKIFSQASLSDFIPRINDCLFLLNKINSYFRVRKTKLITIRDDNKFYDDRAIIVCSKFWMLYPELLSLKLLVLRTNFVTAGKINSVEELFLKAKNFNSFNVTRDKVSFDKVVDFIKYAKMFNIKKLFNKNIKENYLGYNHDTGIGKPTDQFKTLLNLTKLVKTNY